MNRRMNIKDAIEILSKHTVDMGKKSKQYAEAIEMAIVALKKQMPKKPTIMEDISTVEQGYDCPSCRSIIFEADGDYCPWCGQAIDWSDEE